MKTVTTKKTYDLFTNRALFSLLAPLVIEAALTMSLGLVDSFMVKDVGNYGTAMAAVTNVDAISNVMIQLFSAFGTGGAIITSQYLGADKVEEANKSAKQLVVLMLVASLIVAGVCLLFNHQIIDLIYKSDDDAFKNYSYTYFYLMAASYPFLSVFYACASILRAQRKSLNTMTSSAISFGLNIGLNALFIYVFKLEILGVALATFLSRLFPPVFLMVLLSNKNNLVRVKVFEKFRFDGKMIGKIMYLAIPAGIESCLFQIGKVMTTTLVSNRLYQIPALDAAGNALLDGKGNPVYYNNQNTANSIVSHINSIGSIAGNGINTGTITVIGQAVGTGDVDCVKYYIKKMILLCAVVNALCVGLSWALSPVLIGLFGSSVNDEVISIAQSTINVVFAVQIVTYPLSFNAPAVLKATSDVRYTMISSVISMFVLRVGLGAALCLTDLKMGAMGLWLGMCADWVVRDILFGTRILSGRWKKASGRLDGPAQTREEK